MCHLRMLSLENFINDSPRKSRKEGILIIIFNLTTFTFYSDVFKLLFGLAVFLKHA